MRDPESTRAVVQARTRRRRRPAAPSTPQVLAPKPTGVFARPAPVAPDLRAQARQRTRRAQEAMPGPAVALPVRPKLAHYTDAQRNEIIRATTQAIHRYRDQPIAGRAPTLPEKAERMRALPELAKSGDKATRDALHKVEGASRRKQQIADVLLGRYIKTKTGASTDPLTLGRAARQPNPLTNPAAHEREAPEHMKFGGTTKIAGIGIPGLHQALYSTGRVLEQFDRPLHATAGALYAAKHGNEGIGTAALKGLANKEHYTASDLMSTSGNGVVDAVASIGGDVLLNPLSVVGGSVKSVAGNLVTEAQNYTRLADEARRAGDTARAARYAEKAAKAAQKAAKAPANRGIQVGINLGRNGKYTTGKTTANVSRLLGIPKAAEHLREGSSVPAKVTQWAGHVFVPGFRPAGVDPREWAAARSLEHESKAAVRTGTRQAERRGVAFARHLRAASKELKASDPGERVIDAVERAPRDPHMAARVRAAVTGAPNEVPEVVARRTALAEKVDKARAKVKAAQAERVRQERMHADSLRGAGVAHGRAQVGSRTVGGRAGELAALRGTSFAAGGHGMSEATAALARSAANVRKARAAERDAQAELSRALGEASVGRAQLRRELPDLVARHAERSVGALPAHSIDALPEPLRSVARAAQGEWGTALARERGVGVNTAERANYVPHQFPEAIEQTSGGVQRLASQRNAFAGQRQVPGSIAEVNAGRLAKGEDPLFSTNLPALITHRLAGASRSEGRALLHKGLVDEGIARPITHARDLAAGSAHLRPSDALYEMGDDGLKAIEDKHGLPDLKGAQQRLKEGKQVVSMNALIGDRFVRGPLGKLDAAYRTGEPLDKFMSGLRTTFTVLNFPAYDLRNLTGDLWNSWLAGTKGRDVVDAAKAMRVQVARHRAEAHDLNVRYSSGSRISLGGKHKVRVEEALARAERSGAIQTGYFGGERFEHVRGVDENGAMILGSGGRVRRGAGRAGAKVGGVTGQQLAEHPVEALRSLGQVREDMVRFGTWLGAKRRGMSDMDAAAWANKHHFDYTDLTPSERTFLRRAFLFWTFPARNTPLQVQRLLSNPRPFATLQSAREEGAKHSGLPPEWEHEMADYQQRGAGIPVKFGGQQQMLYPGLPVTDLSRLGAVTSPRDQFDLTLSGLNPLFKVPLELGTNRNLFFNSPIQRSGRTREEAQARHWVPAPPELAAVPGLRDALGMRKVKDRKSGRVIWQMSARADYLLRSTPQTGLGLQLFTPAVGSRGQTALQKLLSRSGVNVGPYDKTKNDTNVYYKKLNELTAKQADMKDLHGINSPQYRAVAQQIKVLTKAAQAAGIVLKPQRRRKGGVSIGGASSSGGVSFGSGASSGGVSFGG